MSSVATVKGTGPGIDTPSNTATVIAVVGCTNRQIVWWCQGGLLPDQSPNPGSGSRRTFSRADVECAYAYRQLAALGAQHQALAVARDVIAEYPVHRFGEVLVITVDGNARRRLAQMHTVDEPAAWVVQLRPFPDFPALPVGECGRHLSLPVPAATFTEDR